MMYLTDKQKLILLLILKDSLVISDGGYCPFSISCEDRLNLLNEILNQQPNDTNKQ